MFAAPTIPPAAIRIDEPNASQAPTCSERPVPAGGWLISCDTTMTNAAIPMPVRPRPATGVV